MNLLLPAGIQPGQIVHNATSEALVKDALANGEGRLADSGALMMSTGAFTGRSPEDKYTVKDGLTEDSVWWETNNAIGDDSFYRILTRMSEFCAGKKIYVQDVFACADPADRIGVRVITSQATHALFADNMFINPTQEEKAGFTPDYTVICLPGFEADPTTEGVKKPNFAILNLSRRMVIIGGTGYTGEIKKSIFTVLNFLLPRKGMLSMHCSANVGADGKSAIFFGLSGTGKTTLSADPNRGLIGDDEHGWSQNGIFNFEGGCYAKVINLSKENEPEIFGAIRPGAMLENVRTKPGTETVDFKDDSVTPNTRVSYPIRFIPNAVIPGIADHPENIFFLTCDALGVLPPIARLNPAQAMFHFVSGYTARVAGTEMDVKEPKMVFSACFGAPFLPLHPMEYAHLLRDNMEKHKANVYLISTGWTGGGYGVGKRISIPDTRAIITAALEGHMAGATWTTDPTFGFEVPTQLHGVPATILQPRNTWENKEEYDAKARYLAQAFLKNIEKFSEGHEDILAGAPRVPVEAAA